MRIKLVGLFFALITPVAAAQQSLMNNPDDPGGGGAGGGTSAPFSVVSVESLPTNHLLEMVLNNGLVVSVDPFVDRVYYSTDSGTIEKPLYETLFQETGDAQKTTSIILEMRNMLDGPEDRSSMKRSTSSTFNSMRATSSPRTSRGLMAGGGGGYQPYRCYDMFWGCYSNFGGSFRTFYFDSGYGGRYGTPNTSDYRRWEDLRWAACERGADNSVNLTAALAGTAASCGLIIPAAPTILGSIAAGLGCAGGALLSGWNAYKYNHDLHMCSSTYPGGH